MTVAELLKKSEVYLTEKKTADPKTEAELLLLKILQCTKTELILQKDKPLSPEQIDGYRQLIVRRGKHEPVQYITGEAPFMDLVLEVTPAVLIPRFDTEALVVAALEHMPNQATVIDVGTGSGAIALAIAQKRPKATIYALDVSEKALEIARRNADKYGLSNVRYMISDCLQGLLHEDVSAPVYLISNPPYVSQEEYAELPQEIRGHEPKQALVAKDNGLSFYKQITAQAAVYGDILAGVFFEVGDTQAAAVEKILQQRWSSPVRRVRDVGGKERVVYTLL